MSYHTRSHLDSLESESIHIIREAWATTKNPVLLYSIGKDSSVLLNLAMKAFMPGKFSLPVMHIDTGFKFSEMIDFRDKVAKKFDLNLIVKKNTDREAMVLDAHQAHTDSYIYLKKTKPLLDAIIENKFDCAFGGARRDEEKSRAKERIFSLRNEHGIWDPKNQRPELWHNYNTFLSEGQTLRVFPLSNWTELDIWQYIKKEQIEVVPLYFAKKMKVVQRNGVWLRLDNFVVPREGEIVKEAVCRYRTLGCSPSTGVVFSSASNLDEIIAEVSLATTSERVTRAIDSTGESSMEIKKKGGYF